MAGNALVEELIGQRLLDNAFLIDQLLASRGLESAQIDQIAARNHLRKIEFLDRAGQKLASLPVPRGDARPPASPWGMGMMGMTDPGMHQRMQEGMERWMGPPGKGAEHGGWPMPFMWGWRSREAQPPAAQGPALPPAVKERKFWEGSDYGVAIPATSFPGIIAVHADARILLEFRDQVGMQRLLEELGRQGDIAYVALLDGGGQVVAHSDTSRVGTREPSALPVAQAGDRTPVQRRFVLPGVGEVYEVSRPFPLGKDRQGVLRLGLSVAPIQAVWAQDQRNMVIYTGTILLVGILGVLAIFLNQRGYLWTVQALQEAAQRDRRLAALGNLAAGVAHEIRNPLNAIGMGLQRLIREWRLAPDEDQAEYARLGGVLQGEVNRLNEMVERFLQLARPARLTLGTCPVEQHLGELLTLVREEAAAKGITIETALALNGATARLDCRQVHQALLNIIVNAFQAMSKGGTLRLTARTAQGRLEVTIHDTGQGIAPEHLDRIFEPYFTTKEGGTGLGLALTQRIVEAHGGTIIVDSRPGKGSTFRIGLPLAGPPEAPHA
jgi:signal transduction histidine kinase